MRALERKLLRDLNKHRAQVVSIALLVACAVMAAVAMRGTFESVRDARDRYYARYRFADVFASLKRAPEWTAERIAELPGVGAVQTRVVLQASLEIPRTGVSAVGLFVSIPSVQRPMPNDLHIQSGRYVAPDRNDEVLVSTLFARSNNLGAGDTLVAVINGRWQRLRVAGIATSPEYVYEIGAGNLFVDNSRFGILWMRREALAAAAGMQGAFNNVALLLAPSADERPVIEHLDRILAPFGGVGAIGRRDQASNEIISNELEQLSAIARIFPLFFLGIAAFLLNVVLSRLIATQRNEIGTLKAFGYSDRMVGAHFLGFAVAAVILGAILGVAAGAWLGGAYTELYRKYFGFPDLAYHIGWPAALSSIALSGLAALSGAAFAIRKASQLPPAQAMRPPSPAQFRPLWLEQLGFSPPASPAARMVMRNLERRPFRTAASAAGIALASAVLVAGMYPFDGIDLLFDLQFRRAQRDDLSVAFASPVSSAVAHELNAVDGVRLAELTRSAAIRYRRAHISRTAPLLGLDPQGMLRTLVDARGSTFAIPEGALVLTKSLARVLRAEPGDSIELVVLERGSLTHRMQIGGLIDEPIGFGAYTDRRTVNRLLAEGDVANGAGIAVDRDRAEAVSAELRNRPLVAAVTSRQALLEYFERTIAESILISAGIVIFAAVVMAGGVVYNGARIALSERGRELATLRVLGFSRREVSTFFLAEQGAVIALGLPLGAAAGFGLAAILAKAFATERFSFPVTIYPKTYFFSIAVVLAAAVAVALLVRRRIDRLDMIATLKVGD